MKKITRKELNEILEEHEKWLNGNGGKRADLSNTDLSDANLSRADLSGADLSDADLSDADLSRADLSDADLYKADLDNAKLNWCNTENVEGQRILSVQVDTSRENNKISYWEDLGIWTTGCFQGTLEELKESIERKHKDNEFLYDRYQRAIEYILKEVEVEE